MFKIILKQMRILLTSLLTCVGLKATGMLMLVFLLANCSIGFKTSPEISQVKKSAFLSVYINNEFYNHATYKEDIGIEMLNFFEQDVTQKENQIPKNLANYFVSEFFKRYENIPAVARGIDISPPSEYSDSPQYQLPIREDTEAFDIFNFDNTFDIKEYYFSSSDGLKLIPLNSLVKRIKIEGNGEGEISDSTSFSDIGKFGLSLGMDGLLIAELDASYEKISFLTGSKVKPLVNLRIILINSKGSQVLAIGKEAKEDRKHFSGDVVEASISEKDKIVFSSNPNNIETAYRVAIDEALDSVFSSIAGIGY